MGFSSRQLICSIVYLSGSISFGFINNFYAPVYYTLKQDFPELEKTDFELKLKLFNHLGTFFACLGGFIIHFLIKLVRKRLAFAITHLVCFIIWLLLLSFNPDRIIFGIVLRSIHGLCYGGFATITQILFCENVPHQSICFYGCLNSIGITGSIALIDVIGALLNWRVILLIGALINFAGGLSIFLLPDNFNTSYQYDNLLQKKYIDVILKGSAIMFFQQLGGINAIQANLSDIMSRCGMSFLPLLQASIASLSQVLGVFVSMFAADALGTHTSYVVSSIGSIVLLIVYSLYFKMNVGVWYPTFAIFLYMLCFGIGLSCVPWYVGNFYYHQGIRTMGCAIITFVSMFFAVVVMLVFPIWNELIGEFATLYIFAGITVFSVIFGFIWVPDQRIREECEITLI